MRAQLRTLLFEAVFAAGASVFLGTAAPARGEELFRYSNGALAVGGNSSRGGSTGLPRGRTNFQAPVAAPGYRRVYPQPAYPVPAPNPAQAAGYWYYVPQANYQVPGAVTGYRYYYPAR